jgi:ribosomal protein L20A (L18A)
MNKKYKVVGTSRQCGAIGKMENFSENVTAENSINAADMARDAQYSKNREHVSIKTIVEIQKQDESTL